MNPDCAPAHCTPMHQLSDAALEQVRTPLRAQVPTLVDDRYFLPDMVAATALVRAAALTAGLGVQLPGVDVTDKA